MSNLSDPAVIIRAGDLERLTQLAHDLADELDPLGSLLLRKLARAEVRDSDQVSAARVSLESFATYRISGRDQRRLLIHPRDSMWPPAELSVASPLGIALLGTAAGDRLPVVGTGMQEPPWVEVLGVEAGGSDGFRRGLPLGSRRPFPSLADRH